MTVWIKRGVMGDLQSIAQKGLGKLIAMYEDYGLDFYITSIREGNHGPGSFHYLGLAVDFKKHGGDLQIVKNILGPDWDVIEHPTHVHIEYDPKGG